MPQRGRFQKLSFLVDVNQLFDNCQNASTTNMICTDPDHYLNVKSTVYDE